MIFPAFSFCFIDSSNSLRPVFLNQQLVTKTGLYSTSPPLLLEQMSEEGSISIPVFSPSVVCLCWSKHRVTSLLLQPSADPDPAWSRHPHSVQFSTPTSWKLENLWHNLKSRPIFSIGVKQIGSKGWSSQKPGWAKMVPPHTASIALEQDSLTVTLGIVRDIVTEVNLNQNLIWYLSRAQNKFDLTKVHVLVPGGSTWSSCFWTTCGRTSQVGLSGQEPWKQNVPKAQFYLLEPWQWFRERKTTG